MHNGVRAHGDFETGSPVDLKSAGVHRYAEHPQTRVWCLSWSLGHKLVFRWRPGWPDPVPLLNHIQSGGTFVAHNAIFERTIWAMLRRTIVPHWPELRIEQMDCTLSRALASGLPGGLDDLAKVLNLPFQKDMEGYNLMRKMMRPRKIMEDGTCIWWDSPENIERLMAYCDRDVLTEESADEVLMPLSPHEREVWELDQRINDRGIGVDEVMVNMAADVIVLAKREADKRMRLLTGGKLVNGEVEGGAVKRCTEVGKIVQWINDQGVACESMRKGDHYELLLMADYAGRKDIREVIELRQEAAKTSVAKYDKTNDCVCEDGSLRGLLQYHGAGPGRWAGRLVQPQNYPRVDAEKEQHIVDTVVSELTKPQSAKSAFAIIKYATGKPLVALSKALRATFVARPGRRFVGGDFANIEGRINAWLAGEEWKLEAFRAYDAGTGPDLYKITAAKIVGKDIKDVTKAERQAQGKVPELALGYQGGVGAFVIMGQTYLVRAEDLIVPVRSTVSEEQWDSTLALYAKAQDKAGLPPMQWAAIKCIVVNWRKSNAKIMAGWWELQDAAIEAVDSPGRPVWVYSGRVCYMVQDNVLYCRLPSGRLMCYNAPFIRETVQTLVDKNGEEYDRLRRTVWYQGKDRKTGQWGFRYLYGGLQCENIVQATARCVMDRAMLRVEREGYPLVLTVHDELLAEPFASVAGSNYRGSAEYFAELMSVREDWFSDLPVAVAAWEDERYVK